MYLEALFELAHRTGANTKRASVTSPVMSTYQEDIDKVVAVDFAIHVPLRKAEVAHSTKPDPEHVVAYGELNVGRIGLLRGVVVGSARVAKTVSLRRCVDDERAIGDICEQATGASRERSACTRRPMVQWVHLRCRGLFGEGAERRLQW